MVRVVGRVQLTSPRMGRSYWSRWHVDAYASVELAQLAVCTEETTRTKSPVTPAPSADVEHDDACPPQLELQPDEPQQQSSPMHVAQTVCAASSSSGMGAAAPLAAVPHVATRSSLHTELVVMYERAQSRAKSSGPATGSTASACSSQPTAAGSSSLRRKLCCVALSASIDVYLSTIRTGAKVRPADDCSARRLSPPSSA
mmetsp:Transcript_40831/g.119201  ORF Transcript_40831/g.119201 Transcript_40831/m.119201 type:complete len:200 (+) Transcript_40831:878-1477(+)